MGITMLRSFGGSVGAGVEGILTEVAADAEKDAVVSPNSLFASRSKLPIESATVLENAVFFFWSS